MVFNHLSTFHLLFICGTHCSLDFVGCTNVRKALCFWVWCHWDCSQIGIDSFFISSVFLVQTVFYGPNLCSSLLIPLPSFLVDLPKKHIFYPIWVAADWEALKKKGNLNPSISSLLHNGLFGCAPAWKDWVMKDDHKWHLIVLQGHFNVMCKQMHLYTARTSGQF